MKDKRLSGKKRKTNTFPLDLESHRQQYNGALKDALVQRGLKEERFGDSWIALEGTPLRCEVEEERYPGDDMHFYTLYYNDVEIALIKKKTSHDHQQITVFQTLTIEPNIDEILPDVLLEHDPYVRQKRGVIAPISFNRAQPKSKLSPPPQPQQHEKTEPNIQWQVTFPTKLTAVERFFLGQIGIITQVNAVDKFESSLEGYRYCSSTRGLYFNGIKVAEYSPTLTVNSNSICDALALNPQFTSKNGTDFLKYQYITDIYDKLIEICSELDLEKKSARYQELMALRIPGRETTFDYYVSFLNKLKLDQYANWVSSDIAIHPAHAHPSLPYIKSDVAQISPAIIKGLQDVIDQRISEIGNHWGILYNIKLSNEKKIALETLKKDISAADITTIDTLTTKISAWVDANPIIDISRSRISFWKNEATSTRKMLDDVQETLSPKKK